MKARRLHVSASIAVALTVCAACSLREGPNPAEEERSSTRLILEVLTDNAHGVHPEGRIVDLRLYSDGTAEYETFPEPMVGAATQGRVPRRLKTVRLRDADFSGLRHALSELDISSLRPEYAPRGMAAGTSNVHTITVAVPHGTVSFKVRDFEQMRNTSATSDLPSAVLNLLKHALKVHRSFIQADWAEAAG
jgi:hypothetical protein